MIIRTVGELWRYPVNERGLWSIAGATVKAEASCALSMHGWRTHAPCEMILGR